MNASATAKKPKAEKTPAAPSPEGPRPGPAIIRSTPIDQIRVGWMNHRVGWMNHRAAGGSSDNAAIVELASSMAKHGLQQPIGVMPAEDGYQLVWGHRRLEAARSLGWTEINASVLRPDADVAAARAIENLQRRDLNPVEEAIAVAELFDQEIEQQLAAMGMKPDAVIVEPLGDTFRSNAVAAVARRLGKTEAWVRDRYFLGTLDGTTRGLVIAGRLPMQHARELAKVADLDVRAELAERAAGHDDSSSYEGLLPLDDLRRLVARQIRRLDQVAWRLDVPIAGAPACNECPSNSRNQTGLFDRGEKINPDRFGSRNSFAVTEAGVCMNASCYGKHSAIANRQISTAVRRVQVTVKGAKPAEREETRKTAVRAQEPGVVQPEKFKRLLAAKLKDAGDAPTAAKPGAPAKRAGTPEAKARRLLEEAGADWARDAIKVINKSGSMSPLQRLLLHAISQTRVFFDGSYGDSPKAQRARERCRELIGMVIDGGIDNVKKVAAEPLQNDWRREWHDDYDEDLVEHVGKVLNVKLPPRPKLEDFMPKAKGPDSTKPGKPAGKKAKAAKPAAKAPAADEADDQDGDL